MCEGAKNQEEAGWKALTVDLVLRNGVALYPPYKELRLNITVHS